ncbi:cutinase family protein (plasmid) [Gordonia pseudamarae]|nr:cutinase family protein [Gordonia pseudamarae]
MWIVRGAAALSVAGVVAVGGTVPAAHADKGTCAKLYVFGVQGTGDSSADTSPTTDSGMLSSVMKPLMSMAGSIVQRAYVPYPAGFGGAVGDSNVPFDQSVQKGLDRTISMTKQVATKCPDTMFAYTGNSQGTVVVKRLMQQINSTSNPISADRVGGISMFGDASRPQGSGPFPGTTATRPSPAPGTDGKAVSTLPAITGTSPSGGGITPPDVTSSNYGPLAGRVLSNCQDGDLACDAPADSPIVRMVANLAGQSTLNLDDPIKSLTSIAEAMANMTAKTIVPVINEDIGGETIEDLTYSPNTSMSERLAAASDPRTPMPSLSDGINALLKVGTIGLNAITTVVQDVFTPETITALATTGLTNPVAALTMLGTKVLASSVKLAPPATINRWINEAYATVDRELTSNKDLLDVSNLIKYWNTVQSHGSYTTASTRTGGISPARYTAEWFAAIAADLDGRTFTPSSPDGVPAVDASSAPTPMVVPTIENVASTSTASATPTTETTEPSSVPELASTPTEQTERSESSAATVTVTETSTVTVTATPAPAPTTTSASADSTEVPTSN